MNSGLGKKGVIFFRLTEAVLVLLMIIFGGFIITPRTATALSLSFFTPAEPVVEHLGFGQLPFSNDIQPIVLEKVPITAYSSEVGQTDSTPFITASGTTVRRGVVATNFLPIGARVRFPELYGDAVFIVEDRMNARYNRRFDIWMEETADARNFGIQWTTVEVF